MKINDQKDLAKLIALCRKTGVESIRVDGVELHLGALPQKASKLRKDYGRPDKGVDTKVPGREPTIDEILSDGLTEEQLLYYSVTSQPDSSAADQN